MTIVNERYCVARASSERELEAYLPSNYKIISEYQNPSGKSDFVIVGHDDHGWTLNGYVIPRLGSGLIWAKEYPTFEAACEAAAAAMN